ncbi:disulfide bond formation protein DsbB [Vibrio zhugei]|uniref:Disulfide bond formation protein B n=1 Tax=Vibrio zhugei TaxID=2479546 RepID=A0ABV7C9F3_9VIBR|nr:disulfide bond formation protein DsbB [Vibrio zhugei]
MTLFSYLNTISRQRLPWLLLFAFVVFFEGCALFFQHVLGLAPCVMCIYERIAMLGIGGAALIGAIAPNNRVFRWVGLLLWGGCTYKGVRLALEHVNLQFHPSPFTTCDRFVTLPSWLPLNDWMPWMFKAYGDCGDIVWQFLSLSMPQWLVIIFIGNLVAFALLITSQCVKPLRSM